MIERNFSSVLALILFCGATAALASPAKPTKAAETTLASKCAAYGPGFIASESLQTCVKVGGRVRVEYRWTSQKH